MVKKLPIKLNKKELLNLLKEKDRKLEKKDRQIKKKDRQIKEKDRQIKINKNENYEDIIKGCSAFFYTKYDKTQEIINTNKANKGKKKRILLNNLKKLLDNLSKKEKNNKGKKKSKNHDEINEIINIKIGNKISNKQFINSVKTSIKNIENDWNKKEIFKFKKDLNNLDYINIDSEDPLSFLKKDIIIDLLLQNHYKSKNKEIRILKIKNCSKIPLKNGIKFENPKNDEVFTFNKEFIKKKILNNIGIINSYYFTIQKFTKKQYMKFDVLKKKIIEMIDNTNIYFCDLPSDIYGVTISNGDIYIRGDFLQEVLVSKSKNIKNIKKIQATAICKIYLTLLHEFAHKLHYMIRKEYENEEKWMGNFFIPSEQCDFDKTSIFYFDNYDGLENVEIKEKDKEENENEIFNESGNYFDSNLYLGNTLYEIIEKTYEFFLFEDCTSYDTYKNTMNEILSSSKNNGERASNSKYRSDEKKDRPQCLFSISRNETF